MQSWIPQSVLDQKWKILKPLLADSKSLSNAMQEKLKSKAKSSKLSFCEIWLFTKFRFEKLSWVIFLQSNKADGMIWPVDKDDNWENEKPVWNKDGI